MHDEDFKTLLHYFQAHSPHFKKDFKNFIYIKSKPLKKKQENKTSLTLQVPVSTYNYSRLFSAYFFGELVEKSCLKIKAFTQLWWSISHFRVPPGLFIKTRLHVSAQPLIWKWFFILKQIKLIITRKVVHLASFWKWGVWNSKVAYSPNPLYWLCIDIVNEKINVCSFWDLKG